MKQDEIIELARQAGMEVHGGKGQIRIGLDVFTGDDTTNQVVAFAKLVATKEREACANMCDLAILQNQEAINELEDDEHIAKCFIQGAMTQLVKTSKAIRARGEA
jgi:oligoribonuclease (3'-5' exoribonuclease)